MFVFFVLAAAALAAESTDVTARPVASAAVRTTVTLHYDILAGRLSGQVNSAKATCKKNRAITVKSAIGQIVAKTRTNRRGRYVIRRNYRDLVYATKATDVDVSAFALTEYSAGVVCKQARSREYHIWYDSGCRSSTLQDSRRPDEDVFGVGCPIQIAKIGEVAMAPITSFQNPGFAVAPPGAQGTRQIPGLQLDPNWIEYSPSPVLEPRWVFFNNLQGLPDGTTVALIPFTSDGRAQLITLTTK